MKNLVPKRVMEYIVITFAVILMDVGIYVFKFPNNFSFGGVSGMAVVFSHFIPMTSAQINLVINLILLVIGFMILGKRFWHEDSLCYSCIFSAPECVREGFSNGKSTHREYYAGAVLRDHPSGTGCCDPVF